MHRDIVARCIHRLEDYILYVMPVEGCCFCSAKRVVMQIHRYARLEILSYLCDVRILLNTLLKMYKDSVLLDFEAWIDATPREELISMLEEVDAELGAERTAVELELASQTILLDRLEPLVEVCFVTSQGFDERYFDTPIQAA